MGLPRDHLATNTPETGIFQPEGRMRGALRTILINTFTSNPGTESEYINKAH